MQWIKPEIRKVDLGTERPNLLDELNLALATEEAWADVGGMTQYLIDTAAKYGGIAHVVELMPEIEILQEPQPPGDPEMCEAICRNPCTQRRA